MSWFVFCPEKFISSWKLMDVRWVFFPSLSVSLPFATTLVCLFNCLLKDSLRMSSLVFPLLISLADSFHLTFLLRKTNTHTHTLTILRNAIHNLVLSVFLAPFLTSLRACTLAISDCSLGIGCAMHPLLSELLFMLFLSRRVCPFFHLHQKNTKIQFKIYHVNHFFRCFTVMLCSLSRVDIMCPRLKVPWGLFSAFSIFLFPEHYFWVLFKVCLNTGDGWILHMDRWIDRCIGG